MLPLILLGESSMVIYGDQDNDYDREGYCKETKNSRPISSFSLQE